MNYQHIRNATAIIEFAGIRFLIDPFFSPKGTLKSVPSQHNTLNNPIVDLPYPVTDIINAIDAVIVTHMHHFDHFDAVAIKVLNKSIPIFAQNEIEKKDMQQLGFKEVYALSDKGVSFKTIKLYRTDAEHGHPTEAQQIYDALGIPSDASGVVFTAPNEGTLYLAGDTLWNESIERTINTFQPKTIVLNAGRAEFFGGIPILMGTEGIINARKTSPHSNIIVVHLEAVNHARVTRNDARNFIHQNNITDNIYIPEDGETIRAL